MIMRVSSFIHHSDLVDGSNAVVRHRDVDQSDVWLVQRAKRHRFPARCPFTGAEKSVIVDDDNRDRLHSSPPPLMGSTTETRVPPSGVWAMSTDPPRLSTRSHIAPRPRPPLGRSSTRLSPAPSLTDTATSRSLTRQMMVWPRPPACQKALFRPSCMKRKTQTLTAAGKISFLPTISY